MELVLNSKLFSEFLIQSDLMFVVYNILLRLRSTMFPVTVRLVE